MQYLAATGLGDPVYCSHFYVLLNKKGVDTRIICAILTAVIGLGDPVYSRNGRCSPYCAHCIAPYTTEKSQSHRGFLPKSRIHHGILLKSQGHGGFSGRVTRSQPNFRRSQIVTPVAAVSIAHIGVTTFHPLIIIIFSHTATLCSIIIIFSHTAT